MNEEIDEENLLELIYQDCYICIPLIAFTRKSFVLKAVKYYGFLLHKVSDILKKDPEVVLEAIKQNVHVLRYASEILRSNKQFILNAVEHKGLALLYASNNLRDDAEIVFKAIGQCCHALKVASDRLKNDKEFMINCIEYNNSTVQYISDELKKDTAFILKAVILAPSVLKYISKDLLLDTNLLCEILYHNIEAIHYIPEKKSDKMFMFTLIKKLIENEIYHNQKNPFEYLSDTLISDKNFVLKIFTEIDDSIYDYLPPILKEDKNFILEILSLRNTPYLYPILSPCDQKMKGFLWRSLAKLYSY